MQVNNDYYKGQPITNEDTDTKIYFDVDVNGQTIEVIVAEINDSYWIVIPRHPENDDLYPESPEFATRDDVEFYCKLKCES